MTRVAVFVDYQNCYMRARNAFDWTSSHFTYGQVDPLDLGSLLVDRGRDIDSQRRLVDVQLFRGEPSTNHSPVAAASAQRQLKAWRSHDMVSPTTRPLRYRQDGTGRDGKPNFRSEEKGIDVLLALAMVMGAREDQYDVAVLFTADSDLVPAVEVVLELGKRCELAAWVPNEPPRRQLHVPGRNLWCHWLDEDDYADVCDPTDYTHR